VAVTTDPKRAMVDAAEALMAQRGIAGVSLREVQIAAGQKNKSAAHYHFGTREGLITAILESRMRHVDERRHAALRELDAAGRGDDLRGLVEAFVYPIVEMSLDRPGSSYARFLSQAYRDDTVIRIAGQEHLRGAFLAWSERVSAQMAHIPAPLQRARIERVASMVIHTLALWEGGRGEQDIPLPARLDDLVDSCVAVVNGPVSRETRSGLRARPRKQA
jgi:AcrR family transcriptional regulator